MKIKYGNTWFQGICSIVIIISMWLQYDSGVGLVILFMGINIICLSLIGERAESKLDEKRLKENERSNN